MKIKKPLNDEDDKHPFYSTDALKEWKKRCLELERIAEQGHKKSNKKEAIK